VITYVNGILDVSSSNSTGGPSGGTPPVVPVTGLDWTTVKVGRKNAVNELVVTFSGALNAADADDLVAGALDSAERKRKVTVYSKPVPLTTATYNAAASTVTLALRGKPPAKTMQLTIAAADLLDAEGREIEGNGDGQAGDSFVATLISGGVISMARSTAEVRAHRVAAAVDALTDDGPFRVMRRGYDFRHGAR
jgi:hypothetical protein